MVVHVSPEFTVYGSQTNSEGMQSSLPGVEGKLVQPARRWFAARSCTVSIRCCCETDWHVSPFFIAYVAPAQEEAAVGAVVVAVTDADSIHGGLADGSALIEIVVWQDEAIALSPLAKSAFDARGISSCVLIADKAQSLHMMFGSAVAVLSWFCGLIPASSPRTKLQLSLAL